MAYTGAGICGATDWVSYVAASAGLLTQLDGIVYGAKDLHKGWQEAKEKNRRRKPANPRHQRSKNLPIFLIR